MKQLLLRHRNYYVMLAVCAILYTAMTMLGPTGPNNYDLSATQIRLLQLSFVVPIILIWSAAFFGALWFRAYAETIKKSPDGQALLEVSRGLLILAIGLVVSSLVGTLRQTMLNEGYAAAFEIISNYLGIGFGLAAFYSVFSGSKKLLAVNRITGVSARNLNITVAGLAVISLLYTLAILRTPYRNSTPDPQTYNSYFLPDWLIVSTIIVPYILSWAFGAIAALNIWSYSEHTNGVIYKAALSNLVKGVLAITVFSISIQFLTAVATSLQNLGLASLLALVYLIIALYAVGFLFIASGAKKLSRIEEV